MNTLKSLLKKSSLWLGIARVLLSGLIAFGGYMYGRGSASKAADMQLEAVIVKANQLEKKLERHEDGERITRETLIEIKTDVKWLREYVQRDKRPI